MTEFNQNSTVAETGLFEELEAVIQYEPATSTQRFLNWFIDNLLMRFGLSYVTGAFLGIILQLVAPDFLLSITDETFSLNLFLLAYLVGILNYLLYYTICEKAFKGYTLGKLITGTRAIRMDGGELTFRDAFLRSLSRLVPFEVFSGFGEPWHDVWTNTTVVKAR